MSPIVSSPSSTFNSSVSSNSPDTSSKRGFLKKILGRANSKSSRKRDSTSSSLTITGSDTPPSISKALNDNGRSSRRHSFNAFIDDDDTFLIGDESDKHSLSSGGSLESTHDDHLYDGYNITSLSEKVRFPTLNESNGEGPDIDIGTSVPPQDSPWHGLNVEALNFPKYIRTSRKNKHSPKIINNLFLAQELHNRDEDGGDDRGSSSSEEEDDVEVSSNDIKYSSKDNSAEVFVLEFSRDGKYLAAAGRNSVIKIWKVISSPLGRLETTNTPRVSKSTGKCKRIKDKIYDGAPIFHEKPYRVLKGHTQSVLSLNWSKNNFLISGSMDRTVKLWHVDRDECLQTFDHEDFVTCVKFHPNDDRFFLSGSLDNKVRLWSILENSVSFCNALGDNVLITSLAVTPDGEFCVVGGFYGTVVILEVNGLHIKSKIDIKDRSLVHPFGHKNGNKITGIQIYETLQYDEQSAMDSLSKWAYLLTTNDSKVRLVNHSQKKLVTRFKGLTNNSSSIYASLTDDHNHIVCGSEDHWCYVWENNNSIINNKLRQHLQELMIESKNHLNDLHFKHKKYAKVIQDNKLVKKLLDSNSQNEIVANENNSYTSFHAHNSKVNAAIFAPESTKKLLELSDDAIYDLTRRFREFSNNKHDTKHNINEVTYGHIIVTTDRFGCIRVFRQDSAYLIRKKLIELHKHKSTSETRAHSPSDGKPKLVMPNLAAARKLARTSKSPAGGNDSYFNFKGRSRSKSQIHADSPKLTSSGRTTPNFLVRSSSIRHSEHSPIRSVIYNSHFNVSQDSLTSL